jgi:Mrp family chromosome partitioning ATPase
LNIRLSMTHEDATAAKAIVQAVRDAYVKRNADDQQAVNNVALGQLKKMLDDTKAAFDQKQALLGQRMSETDMTGAEKWLPEVLAASHSRLAELRKSRFAIDAELTAAKAKELPKPEVFMNSVNPDNDPQIQMWEKTRIEAVQQDNVLQTKFNAQPQHPDRKALRGQITRLEAQIAARTKELRENAWKKYEAERVLDSELKITNLTWNLQAVDSQIEKQEKSLAEQEAMAKEVGNKALPIATLREEVTDLKEQFKTLNARIEEVTKQNSPLGRLDAKLVGLPLTPTVDKRPKLALAANGMGFLLGMGVLVILMKLRDKIDHAEDLPSTFQPLIVGTVSHAGAAARGLEGRMSKKILGEEMRLLHANLLPPGPMQRRIMMITSPTPSNGKTSIASQLALSLAKSGLEVLLIDADLRKRDLSTMFDVGFRPGLSVLLLGRTPDLIRPVDLLPNLRLMGAGT